MSSWSTTIILITNLQRNLWQPEGSIDNQILGKRLSNTFTCTLFVSWYSWFHCALPDKVTHNQSTSTQDPHCKWVQHETNHWWDLTTKQCIHHDQEPQLIPPLAINHTNTYKIFLTRTFSMVKRTLNTFHCVAFIGKKCLHQCRACSQIFSTR